MSSVPQQLRKQQQQAPQQLYKQQQLQAPQAFFLSVFLLLLSLDDSCSLQLGATFVLILCASFGGLPGNPSEASAPLWHP